MTVNRITIGLLVGAALLSLLAWRMQTAAADSLAVAQELQSRDVSSDSEPPSAEVNRRIIVTLERAIGVRRDIESVLKRIEDDIAFVEKQQSVAETVTGQGKEQLSLIGAAISASVNSSRSSSMKLHDLNGSLSTSAALAEAIAQELAELDRRFGPEVGGGPR